MADRTVSVDVRGDTRDYVTALERAERATESFRLKAERFDGKTYRAKVKLDVEGDAAAVDRLTRNLNNRQYRIGIHVDRTGASNADLATLDSILRRMPRNTTSRVNVNTSGAMGGVSNLAAAIAALGPVGLSAGAIAAGGIGALTTITTASVAGAGAAVLAFKGLGDAVSAYNAYSLEPTAENAKKVEEATRGMDASFKSLASTVASARPELDGLRRTAQAGLLPGVEEGFRSVLGVMPQFNNLIGRTSEALGQLAREGGAALNSPEWRSFFDFMATAAPPILLGLGRSLGNLASAWKGLSIAFNPVAQQMVTGLENITQKFADWSNSLSTNQGFQEFIAYVQQNGPQMMDTLGALVGALGAIVQAGMPIGAALLPVIEDLADAFATLMRSDAGPWIMGVVAALGALKIASSIAAGIMSLAAAVGRFTGGAGGAGGAAASLASKIGLIGLAVGAAVIAYDSFNTSAAESADALLQGGQAAADMRAELAQNDAKHREYVATMGESMGRLREWMTGMLGTETTTKQATAALQEQMATMAPLARAQAQATIEQSAYDDAVVRFGRNSPQAVDAMRRLGEATANVKLEQRTANQSGMAYFQTLGRIAQEAGPVGDAARRMASGMSQSGLDAMGASVRINGMGQAIATLPDGKQIPITADTGNANVQIQSVVTQLNHLPPGKTVNVGVVGTQAQNMLRSIGLEVRNMPDGTVEVTANTEAARQRLVGIGFLAEQERLFPLGANTGPADQGIKRVQDLAGTPQAFDFNALTGNAQGAIGGVQQNARIPQTFSHDANTNPAQGNVGRIHDMARGLQVFPHDANTGPAAGAVGGIHGVARQGQTFPTDSNVSGAAGSVGDVHNQARAPESFNTDADTGGAWSAITSLRNMASKAVSFVVNAVTGRAGGGPIGHYAAGGQIDTHQFGPRAAIHAAEGAFIRQSPTRHGGTGRLTGPGSGTSDSIALMGSNGEWMIRRRVVAQQGAGLMAMLNAGLADIVPKHVGNSLPQRVSLPAGVKTGSHETRTNNVHNEVHVHNPRPEKASDSVQRRLSRMAEFGMFQ